MTEALTESNDNTFVAVSATTMTHRGGSTDAGECEDPLILVPQHSTTSLATQPKIEEGKRITRAIIISGSRLNLCEFSMEQPCPTVHEYQIYQQSHPLVYSMLEEQDRRRRRLQKEGAVQMNHPLSDSGWMKTLFVSEGRALDFVMPAWCVVVGHAILYTCLSELVLDKYNVWTRDVSDELGSWETFFGIALNATLSLLLVFRLNRAAARWWLARQFFGVLIAKTRSLVSGIVLHASHDPTARDHAIRWTAAYAISVMEFLRGCPELHEDLFAGILSKQETTILEQQSHPPLYAAHQIHYYLSKIFAISAGTPLALAMAQSRQLATLEEQWTILLDKCGGMERIKATPLPIVYVSHLRTFLLVALLLYPYVWGSEWRWSTIPIVALAAFGMLGIEAASVEVEQPFKKNRVNALNMDGFWYVVTFIALLHTFFKKHFSSQLLLTLFCIVSVFMQTFCKLFDKRLTESLPRLQNGSKSGIKCSLHFAWCFDDVPLRLSLHKQNQQM